MDDFFQELNKISSREDQLEAVKKIWQKLGQLKGGSRLEFAMRVLEWTLQYPLLSRVALDIINEVINLAEKTSPEKAALLLGQKAYYEYLNGDVAEASRSADLALKKSRDIGSNRAEVDSLIIKGYLSDVKKEYKKASAWHTMALDKCNKFKRPGLMLNIGTFLSKQGEYSQAWSLITQAKSLARDLAKDLPTANIERTNFNRVVAMAYFELGQIHKGLGDLDGALRAYDKALSLSLQHSFTNEISQIYHHQAKVYSMSGCDSKAMATINKALEVLSDSEDADPDIYFDYYLFMMRKLMSEKHYEFALDTYRYILFEDTTDAQKGFKRLNDLMDNYTYTFSEIVTAIAECLRATEHITEAENLNKEEAAFSELKQQTGYDQKDRDYKLRIQKKRLLAVLRRVFFNETDFVEYKNIKAQYDPKEDIATFTIGDKEIKKTKRYFLVFKYLVDNAGKHVTGKMLDGFVSSQGYVFTEGNSGLRNIVKKMRTEISLAQFLEDPAKYKGSGWMLKAP